jgi:hypothetical protein
MFLNPPTPVLRRLMIAARPSKCWPSWVISKAVSAKMLVTSGCDPHLMSPVSKACDYQSGGHKSIAKVCILGKTSYVMHKVLVQQLLCSTVDWRQRQGSNLNTASGKGRIPSSDAFTRKVIPSGKYLLNLEPRDAPLRRNLQTIWPHLQAC